MLEMRIWSRPADIIRHGSVAGLKSVQWICPQSETKAKGFFNLHDVPCQYVLIISTPSLLKAGQALFPPGFFYGYSKLTQRDTMRRTFARRCRGSSALLAA
jgi:hypothetical protein